MNAFKFGILIFTFLVTSANAEQVAPRKLSQQIDRLALLLTDPATFVEERSSRAIKTFNHYSLAVITMGYVGGNGVKFYIAVFDNAYDSFTFAGMTVPPDWVGFNINDISIQDRVVILRAIDQSGEPPGNGKPVILRYEIEDLGWGGWGLTYLPEQKKSIKQRRKTQ